jgi:hypothetical protein
LLSGFLLDGLEGCVVGRVVLAGFGGGYHSMTLLRTRVKPA